MINILEAIYMTWFTLEFLVRFLSCPDHCKFIKSFMNIIDLLAILPYYLAPLVNQLDSIKQVGQVLRILRIMRVFKMARHSRGLQGRYPKPIWLWQLIECFSFNQVFAV